MTERIEIDFGDTISVTQAATRLKVAPMTVRRWIRAGQIPAVCYYNGDWEAYRLRRTDVERMARKGDGRRSPSQ